MVLYLITDMVAGDCEMCKWNCENLKFGFVCSYSTRIWMSSHIEPHRNEPVVEPKVFRNCVVDPQFKE